MKFENVTVKGSEFSGQCILGPDDTRLLSLLGQKLAPGEFFAVDISGEFSLDWDDDIAMVMLDSVCITYEGRTIDLVPDDCDFSAIEAVIEEHGDHSNWEEDRMSSRIDDYMDRYGDR